MTMISGRMVGTDQASEIRSEALRSPDPHAWIVMSMSALAVEQLSEFAKGPAKVS